VTLSNSTLIGNSAGNNGGALYLPTAFGKLANVTFSGNTAERP
jgi:predicted outer membrane repeat protein